MKFLLAITMAFEVILTLWASQANSTVTGLVGSGYNQTQIVQAYMHHGGGHYGWWHPHQRDDDEGAKAPVVEAAPSSNDPQGSDIYYF